MTPDEYILLFEKYMAGNATPEELSILMAHKDDFELADISAYERTNNDEVVEKRILDKLNESTGHARIRKISGVRWFAAASVLILFSVGIVLWQGYHNKQSLQLLQAKKSTNDVGPGTDKAILTLTNGKKIILNDADNGTLIKQGNITIKKQKNGIVQYMVSASAGQGAHKDGETTGLNTITTPRGGEYHIVLPDGSKVWLNAASSIKFPTVFAAHERKIELTGEAYFEVAKNKEKPFKVKFNDQEVEVLGTHFDIKAYSDDPDTKTTLLEGSVKISRNNIKQILAPGQQAVSDASSKGFNIQKANIQEVMAWKNGYFMFNSLSIQSIMKQASRWYDVDVVYQGNMTDKEYGGRISKYKNISELLKNLELTGTIHFKIEGRRVTVMQ
ncbi:MAG: FecR family protein [Mucilaginibacter sp.]|nr:FecR family protein [Mucilaginibacter sp.]